MFIFRGISILYKCKQLFLIVKQRDLHHIFDFLLFYDDFVYNRQKHPGLFSFRRIKNHNNIAISLLLLFLFLEYVFWAVPKTHFFVLNEFAPAPSIEGDSKRRWNCLDNSPLVKGAVTLFSIWKLRNCRFFQGCSKNLLF
jgi:hypothetical protein